MVKKSCYLLVIFLFCVFAVNTNAQNAFEVDLEISSDNATPLVDNVHHALYGTTFEYKVSLVNHENVTSVSKCEYTLTIGTEVLTGSCLLDTNNEMVAAIPVGALAVGEHKSHLKVTVTYDVSSTDDAGNPVTTSIEEVLESTDQFKIWDEVKFPQLVDHEFETLPDSLVTLAIGDGSGGYDDGWSYTWSESNAVGKEYSFVAEKVNTETVKEIVLCVRNYSPDKNIIWAEELYTFTVIIYPSIVVTPQKYDDDVYYGENVTLGVDVFGGKTDGWKFEWKGLPNEKHSTYSYIAQENSNVKTASTFTLVVTNTLKDEGDWYRNEYTFSVNEWSRGEVLWNGPTDVLSDSVNTYLTLKGGYTGGWTIEWIVDGESISGHDPMQTDKMFENHSSDCIQKNVELVVRNCINADKVGSEVIIRDKVVNVWPKVILPSKIDNVAACVREGLYVESPVKTASGGYYSDGLQTWFYNWYKDGRNVTSDNSKCSLILSMDNQGHTKDIEKASYNLNIYNISPQGSVWVSKVLRKDVNIYRRPKTPVNLMRKGNGTSCILILDSEYSDEELETYEYEFIYGFTDVNGVDHMYESTPKRYYQFDASIYNNPDNTFWVIAQWKYDDALVTSGKCLLDGGIDEDYDASVFGTTTRGALTSINGPACHDIVVTDKYIKADFAENTPMTVNVYTLAGVLVKSISYSSNSSFNEFMDLEDLQKGVYIIKASAGDMHIVKKVVVD